MPSLRHLLPVLTFAPIGTACVLEEALRRQSADHTRASPALVICVNACWDVGRVRLPSSTSRGPRQVGPEDAGEIGELVPRVSPSSRHHQDEQLRDGPGSRSALAPLSTYEQRSRSRRNLVRGPRHRRARLPSTEVNVLGHGRPRHARSAWIRSSRSTSSKIHGQMFAKRPSQPTSRRLGHRVSEAPRDVASLQGHERRRAAGIRNQIVANVEAPSSGGGSAATGVSRKKCLTSSTSTLYGRAVGAAGRKAIEGVVEMRKLTRAFRQPRLPKKVPITCGSLSRLLLTFGLSRRRHRAPLVIGGAVSARDNGDGSLSRGREGRLQAHQGGSNVRRGPRLASRAPARTAGSSESGGHRAPDRRISASDRYAYSHLVETDRGPSAWTAGSSWASSAANRHGASPTSLLNTPALADRRAHHQGRLGRACCAAARSRRSSRAARGQSARKDRGHGRGASPRSRWCRASRLTLDIGWKVVETKHR